MREALRYRQRFPLFFFPVSFFPVKAHLFFPVRNHLRVIDNGG
jgi:hypothetical protein